MPKYTCRSIIIYCNHISCYIPCDFHFWINAQEALYNNINFKAKAYTCTRIDHPQVGPEYEDIDMQPVANTVKHQEQGLELKKNVAYGASKSMAIEKQ